MSSCNGFREGDEVRDFKTKRTFKVATWNGTTLIAEDGFFSTHYRVIRLASHEEHLAYVEELQSKGDKLL